MKCFSRIIDWVGYTLKGSGTQFHVFTPGFRMAVVFFGGSACFSGAPGLQFFVMSAKISGAGGAGSLPSYGIPDWVGFIETAGEPEMRGQEDRERRPGVDPKRRRPRSRRPGFRR